jgi:hypothetical protein
MVKTPRRVANEEIAMTIVLELIVTSKPRNVDPWSLWGPFRRPFELRQNDVRSSPTEYSRILQRSDKVESASERETERLDSRIAELRFAPTTPLDDNPMLGPVCFHGSGKPQKEPLSATFVTAAQRLN